MPDLIAPTLNLADIQGNIIGGFNKDFQEFICVEFGDPVGARGWVAECAAEVASALEVTSFNTAFKSIARRRRTFPGVPVGLQATWVNIAFTHPGLTALGVPAADLAAFPPEFIQGMRARASTIGDVDTNAPTNWPGGLGTATIHALLIVAADDEDDLAREVERQLERMGTFGVHVVDTESGRTRIDQPGHEHFGFKDGISQPGIRGVTNPSGADPNQGQPGQDLLWPGEFVLGYQRQRPAPPPPPTPTPAPNPYAPTAAPTGGPTPRTTPFDPEPGVTATNGPAWTVDGSYLVVRRLAQDVPGFKAFISTTAAAQGKPQDLIGAKLVGRYQSGAPLEPVATLPGVDPSTGDPAAANPAILDDEHINNFEFGADVDGGHVPRAAHIRKSYPRDEPTPGGGEADTQTHRILRRGIAFGPSHDPNDASSAPTPRGLMFLCYQTSIANQFEVIQQQWVNDPDFPNSGDGHDPLIAQAAATRTFALPGGNPDPLTLLQRWVTTTGGEYFFAPSINALNELATGAASQ